MEINAAAENPLVRPGPPRAWHNANFFTAHLALALDGLRLGLVQSAQLSISRLGYLMNPRFTGLRPFLADDADSSGLMMAEYVAADAVARLRAGTQPATLGAVNLSLGLEEHASFSSQAAGQTTDALRWYRLVVACELLAAIRALRQRGTVPPAGLGRELFEVAGRRLETGAADRVIGPDVTAAGELLAELGAPILRD